MALQRYSERGNSRLASRGKRRVVVWVEGRGGCPMSPKERKPKNGEGKE